MRIGSLPQSLAAVLSRFGFSAILLGLLLCVFGPVVAGRQTFFSNLYGTLEAGNYFANPGGRQGYFTTRDSAGMQFIEFPALRVARESLRRGELPLWNPYTGLGRPLIGEMLGSLLNPLKLPLWLWPTQYAFDLYLMGRLLLAGVFLWLLARRVGISPTGAAIAGCAYALNGYFLTYLTQWHLACDVWFPLFLYLVVEARAGHLAKGVLGGAVCWGCMILAGNPQPLLIYLLFAFWFGWAALRQSGEPGGGAAWLREVAVWTLSVLGGAALAAPFLVEALPFYFHARQFHTTGFHLYGNSFVECLWRAVGLQVYWIARSLFPLGVAPLVLGALTLSRRQWRRPLTLALLVFFAIFQMKLLPGVRWLSPLHWIAFAPPFNQILWIKYQGAAYLGLSLLAGFGWDSFARNPSLETGSRERSNGLPRWKRRHWIGFGLVAAAALLATIVAGRWSGALLQGISTHLPFLIPDEYTPVIPLMRFQPLSVFSLFLLLGVLAFFQTKDRSIRVSALAAVVFFCFFCASYRKYDATEPWPGKAPYVEHMEERAGGGRFFALGTTMNTMLSAYFGLQDARMFGPTEPAQAYLLEYDLLLQNRPDNLAWEWYPISANNPQIALSPAMDLLDVRFLVREPYQPPMPAEAERDWRRVYEGEAEIWENRERPGRVFWTPAARYVGDAAEARRQVRAMGTAFQDCAILEGEPPRDWAPAAAPGAQRGKTWVEAYSCNRVVARVDAEQPGVVVLADAFYPRWRAFLDGRPTQVYRAYGALRAVHAPAGRHVIEFRYDTRPFVWGCAVSGASALLFVLGAAAPMTRRKFGMRPSGRHRFVRL